MQSNPFSTRFVSPGAIPFVFPPGIADDQQQARIAEQIAASPASLIVGPHGSGKTTLLRSLHSMLESSYQRIESILLHSASARGFWAEISNRRQNLDRVTRLQHILPAGSLLMIDGIEQLSGWSRRRIVRRGAARGHRILATSHAACSAFTIVYRSSIQPQIIQSVVSSLTADAPAEIRKMVWSELGRRRLSKVTNMRDLLFELYDLVAGLHDQSCQVPQPHHSLVID